MPVERHASVKLRSFDVEGNEVVRDVEGTRRASIQHELDHLDGTLILDRTTREARGDALRLLRRAIT